MNDDAPHKRLHSALLLRRNALSNSFRTLKSQYPWWSPVLLGVILNITAAIAHADSVDWRVVQDDPALFMYSGWRWVHAGSVPYESLWDIKPPVIHEINALLSVVTLGDPALLTKVNIGVSLLAMAITIGMVALYVRQLVSAQQAAVLALLPLVYSPLLTGAAIGLIPKVLSAALGFLAVVGLLYDVRLWVVGFLISLSLATWQASLGFLLAGVVYGVVVTWTRRQWLGFAMGIVGAAIVVVAPFALAGAVEELIIQAILLPVVLAQNGPVPAPALSELFRAFSGVRLIFLPGYLGFALAAWISWTSKEARPEMAMVAALGAWFGVGALAINKVGPGASISLALSLTVGWAVLVSHFDLLRGQRRAMLAGVVLAGLALMAVLKGHIVGEEAVHSLLLNEQVVERCHIRMSKNEVWWLEQLGAGTGTPCTEDISAVLGYILN